VVQRDLPGGKTRRVNVGACNELTLAKAKDRAADLIHELRQGNDPKRRIVVPTRWANIGSRNLIEREALHPCA